MDAAERVRREERHAVERRDAAPGLVFKTAVQPERTPAVTSPKIAPDETKPWWKWTQEHVAYQLDVLREAVGGAIGQKTCELRDELALLRRELAVLRGEIAVERELKDLRSEIATARNDVPRLPDIEARVAAEQGRSEERAGAPEARAGDDQGFPEAVFVENYAAILGSSRVA